MGCSGLIRSRDMARRSFAGDTRHPAAAFPAFRLLKRLTGFSLFPQLSDRVRGSERSEVSEADDSPFAAGNLCLVIRRRGNLEECPLVTQGLVTSLVAKKASISSRAAIVGCPAASMRC